MCSLKVTKTNGSFTAFHNSWRWLFSCQVFFGRSHKELVQRPVSVNCLRKLLVMPAVDRPDKYTEDWGNFVKIILLQVQHFITTDESSCSETFAKYNRK